MLDYRPDTENSSISQHFSQ